LRLGVALELLVNWQSLLSTIFESPHCSHTVFLSMLLHLSVSLMNVVVVQMFIVVSYKKKPIKCRLALELINK
jgi:hypothetical protein